MWRIIESISHKHWIVNLILIYFQIFYLQSIGEFFKKCEKLKWFSEIKNCEKKTFYDSMVKLAGFSLNSLNVSFNDIKTICIMLSAAEIKKQNYKQPLYDQTTCNMIFPYAKLFPQIVITSSSLLSGFIVVEYKTWQPVQKEKEKKSFQCTLSLDCLLNAKMFCWLDTHFHTFANEELHSS